MRIAVDIDSTLHHYWDQLAAVAKQRFGVDLPYDSQLTWGITRLRPEQVRVCVQETHGEANVLAAEPYPGAVETIRAWHRAGHFIHITSHRATDAHDATARWLDAIGLPYDELHCSMDKVARCREIAIDVLIDDSPVNLLRAGDAGIIPATILHPWNRDVCEEEDIVSAPDWPTLARRLEPLLARPHERPPGPAGRSADRRPAGAAARHRARPPDHERPSQGHGVTPDRLQVFSPSVGLTTISGPPCRAA